ncbi:hypothetical protein DFH94DRAFT_637655 [Russula ochroleuca]|uniref:Crinkler effector protein N-terminal domain-containing protein n=1 Tax=Russula ochroleuca TaxID=152965 RepID=A0A9P5JYE1_9AGAM|nr:hypothetical protein DFH94DRAFT_637655 [Russula ochroleuca]
MSRPLELNCLVLGQDIKRIFPVKIDGTESIGTLKEFIKDKKKPQFDNVPADSLEIFKVSFPVDKNLGASLKRFRPEDGNDDLSMPVKRLKGVFGDPIDEHIHVIVQPPPASPSESRSFSFNLELYCFISGRDSGTFLSVKIANTDSVRTLKEAIKEKKLVLENVQGLEFSLLLRSLVSHRQKLPHYDSDSTVHSLIQLLWNHGIPSAKG